MNNINDLLAYHQPLNERAFSMDLMEKIYQAEKRRRAILWLCTFIGLLCCSVYLSVVTSTVSLLQLLTPLNGLLIFHLGLFFIWLWVDALNET